MALKVSLDDAAWLKLVGDDPAATPFHHPAWTETLASTYQRDAYGLILELAGGGIVALPTVSMRSRLVSLPFTAWCAPLTGGPIDPDELDDALDSLRRAERLATMEIRGEVSGPSGFGVPSGFRHELPLCDDFAATAVDFNESRVLEKLRRADREGVEVHRGATTRSLLDDFYPLHVATRHRLGMPVQPRRFFTALGERMLERGLGFTVTGVVSGTPVASALFLAWNGRLACKLSATDRDHQDVGATEAVIGEAIRWGCENDYRSLDFGRTDSKAEGQRTFRLSWGSVEHELTYTRFAERLPQSGSGGTADLLAHALRRSPESVTRAVGAAADRHTA
jgi:CelD/BcsL family acetyltransferase involved in cellulose biosynthesis